MSSRLSRLPPPRWVRDILGSESGYSPTPTETANATCPSMQKWAGHKRLRMVMEYLPTPTASSYGSNQGGAAGRVGKKRKSLAGILGGPENPEFREWLMGFPIGWTDLRPLAMVRFRQWLSAHGPNSTRGFTGTEAA